MNVGVQIWWGGDAAGPREEGDDCRVGMTRSGQPFPELFLALYAELFCLVTVVSSEMLQQQPSPFYSLLTPALYIRGDILPALDPHAPVPIQQNSSLAPVSCPGHVAIVLHELARLYLTALRVAHAPSPTTPFLLNCLSM